jgi:hypothetical protein
MAKPSQYNGKKLSASEEIALFREIHGANALPRHFESLTASFNVLQNRSQMLLSLITICLTVSGFSGPKIVQAGSFARYSLIVGIVFVLFSVFLLLTGPLPLRWVYEYRAAGEIENTLRMLIQCRDMRSRRYRAAAVCLTIGLNAYMISLIRYLFQ